MGFLREPSKILVPVDFSRQARDAIEYALIVAGHFRAEIVLLHVWREVVVPATWGQGAVLDELARSRADVEMERCLEDLEDSGVPIRGRLERGDAVDTILRVAAEETCDLIVMGTHGRTGLSHLLHGSVAEKVVRQAGCPVITLRAVDAKVRGDARVHE